MTTEVILTGLDGSNPLGYLAALGVLDALADYVASDAKDVPKMRWFFGDAWTPAIVLDWLSDADVGRQSLMSALCRDLESFRDEPALELRYEKANKEKADTKKQKKDPRAWDLKPTPALFRAYLRNLLVQCSPRHRRNVDLAAAFATETAVDGSGNTKPTALHFTAGQQEFLRMVGELRDKVVEADLEEALFGPWRYESPLPVLQWDATSGRDYALRAKDPSSEKKLGVAGAEWLAFRGLRFYRVAAVGKRIETSGCFGSWKQGGFRWCLWTPPLTRATVQSVVQLAKIDQSTASERQARGVAVVFEASIRRSAQGGYGSFSPSSVI